MNFQDLLTKMKQIDEGTVEECGMASMPPKQQDNVNMNVTMSGNGAGGIKDLINILKATMLLLSETMKFPMLKET